MASQVRGAQISVQDGENARLEACHNQVLVGVHILVYNSGSNDLKDFRLCSSLNHNLDVTARVDSIEARATLIHQECSPMVTKTLLPAASLDPAVV